jgi:RHS repeat-associated protein
LADAADADGTVSQVEFFANGASIGVDASAPYAVEWVNPAAGSYGLSARATDNLGAQTTSAAVPITVNAPPTVSLSSPAQNASFTAPANITLTADAADADGTVTSVEFYQGTTLITTLGTAPYTFTWTNVPQGAYVLTAKATDDRGAVTTSAPVNITVGAAVGQLYFIHTDHLNTPRLVADSTGTTVWRWDQAEPFGNNPADENPSGLGAFDLPLRLPGQRYDAETGLHYNYFRDYDPSIGRYGESDPIGLRGGLNTYAYVDNSPLREIDVFGLQIAPPGGGTSGGLIGGGAAGGSGVGAAGGGSGSSNAIAKGLHNLIKEFQKPCCPDCEPPVGTKCFRQNVGHGHGPFPPGQSHFHLYVMEQIPYPSCQCTWKQQGGTRGTLDFAPYFLLDCELIPSWIVQHGGA